MIYSNQGFENMFCWIQSKKCLEKMMKSFENFESKCNWTLNRKICDTNLCQHLDKSHDRYK